ncbi:gag/pol protein [Gossypium australe]|uniref:Gag/pol protein n=1 Tax=Gossypium australe TaxID=47621 RepID=A0A5B6W7G9_9ROSI|nr:gag/pol protein [Gossypium australe]
MGEANFVLGNQIVIYRKKKMIALSQALYIDKILEHYSMSDSKKRNQPSVRKSHAYYAICTCPDICFEVWLLSIYSIIYGERGIICFCILEEISLIPDILILTSKHVEIQEN